jgi:two-component system sensor histidine kinase DesK
VDTSRWIERSGRGSLLAFLLFLVFPLGDLATSSLSAAHIAVVVVAATAFVACYLALMWSPVRPLRGTERLGLAALFVLALALALDNSAQWASLFIYVAAVCGMRLRPRAALPGIALSAALAAAVGAIGGYTWAASFGFAVGAAGIGLLLLAFGRLFVTNEELSAAREEIARLAVSEERLRFARDLHDLLGHSLSVIALKSELAGRVLPDDPERAAGEIADIEEVTREALSQVREAVFGYRRMTLAAELTGAHAALSAAGIEASVDGPGAELPAEVETILAWAVREGTTNVIKHSGAQHCEIRMCTEHGTARIEVLDDGRGAGPAQAEGNGLAGLAERAVGRQGRVEAGARADGGFRLHVSVPTA